MERPSADMLANSSGVELWLWIDCTSCSREEPTKQIAEKGRKKDHPSTSFFTSGGLTSECPQKIMNSTLFGNWDAVTSAWFQNTEPS